MHKLWRYWFAEKLLRGLKPKKPKQPEGLYAPFWRVSEPGRCWVCHGRTNWGYLDIGYQHPDCDAYPSEEGDVVVIRGERVFTLPKGTVIVRDDQ
jgi:hypothetical protein